MWKVKFSTFKSSAMKKQLRSSEECVEDMSTTNFTYDVIEYYKVNNNFS